VIPYVRPSKYRSIREIHFDRKNDGRVLRRHPLKFSLKFTTEMFSVQSKLSYSIHDVDRSTPSLMASVNLKARPVLPMVTGG